jgi:hypothetical protein
MEVGAGEMGNRSRQGGIGERRSGDDTGLMRKAVDRHMAQLAPAARLHQGIGVRP